MTANVSTTKNTFNNVLSSDISIIHSFAQISATVLDLDDLLNTALEILSSAFKFSLLGILLVNDKTNKLQLNAFVSDYPSDVLEPLLPAIHQTVQGEGSINKETFFIEQVPNLEQTCLIVPLTIGRLGIGALVVGDPAVAKFSVKDKQLLAVFSSQITVAITNARLYEKSREQQQQQFIRNQIATHLQQLTTIINATLDLDDVLNLILKHIAIVIPYSDALIMLLDGANLIVRAVIGFKEPNAHIGLNINAAQEKFYQSLLLQQYPAVFHDISQTESTHWDVSKVPYVKNTKAWIGAPLVIKNRIIGMFILRHKEAGYFDNADLDLVHAFGNQAAIAIDNAQIYHREQQKVKQFQTVAKISRQATEIHQVQPLLDVVVARLHKDLGYEFVTIFLYYSQTETLHLKSSTDNPEQVNIENAQVSLSGNGIISTVAKTGKALLVNDVSAFSGYKAGPGREKVQSELAIPLITQEDLIGILDVQSCKLHNFSPDDLALTQTIADQLAVAIKTANLFEERDQRMAELIAFNQIGTTIVGPTDLNKTLISVLERIKALYQVEGTSLMTLEGDTLHFRMAVGVSDELLKPFSIKLGQGFAGWVAKHKKALRIDDVTKDKRHYKQVDQVLQFNTQTLLVVPIQIKGRVLGVIELMNRLDGKKFTTDDEYVLSFIASILAITMENSRLFAELTRKADQMAGLFEASQSLTNLNLDEVLQITVKQVVNLLKTQQATVYQIDKTRNFAIPGPSYSNQPLDIIPHTVQTNQGHIGWVIKHKQSLNSNNFQQDTRFETLQDSYTKNINTLLCIPLITADEVIGVLQAVNKQDNHPFVLEDERLMTALVSQAAIAIHNANLFKTTLQREEFALGLGQAGSFINKSLKLDEVLNVICEESLHLFGIDSVSIWHFENQTLSCIATTGVAAKQMLNFNIIPEQSDLLISQAFKATKPLYKNNQTNTVFDLLNIIPSNKKISVMAIPLQKMDTVIGMLLMANIEDPNYFTLETQSRAVIYGNQVSSAIENARLHQETERRLTEVSTLYTVAYHMSLNLNTDRILEDTATVIRLALDSLGCSIYLTDNTDVSLGSISGSISQFAQTLVLKSVQQVISTGNPINYQTPVDFPLTTATQPKDISSLLIVPLRTQGKISGALAVYDKRPYTYGPNEGRLLTIVASQVASALENSKLFNNLQQHAHNLEQALTELQDLHRLQKEFVQNVSHELRTPLTFVKGYIDLILEETLGPVPEAMQNSLDIVAKRTTDLHRLVGDIITHQQLEMNVLTLKEIDLTEIIQLAVNSALPSTQKKGVQLILNISSPLSKIMADPDRISQVFDNLIGNAIKFTNQGDTITVSVEDEGDLIKISVKDTGIGIAETDLNKIFNRFYKVDNVTANKSKGTGLGLAIVKQIIQAHQGHITVMSTLGQGTEFIITLPLYQQNTE